MPSDKDKVNSAAVMLVRKGGLARAKNLTPEQRRKAASKAANNRPGTSEWPIADYRCPIKTVPMTYFAGFLRTFVVFAG
mgnify:CR=1 FL=1